MMRDIKFRAYSTVTGSFDLFLIEDLMLMSPRKISRKSISDDLTIEQYTGLKDKNGVEIYEGDIVSITTIDNYTHQPIHISNKAVKYNEITAGFDNAIHFCGVEVVGNIHQTPELLSN